LLGALYVDFAMLNWMVKGSLIGNIYNRPVAVANFTHFLVGGLALAKGVMGSSYGVDTGGTVGGVCYFLRVAAIPAYCPQLSR